MCSNTICTWYGRNGVHTGSSGWDRAWRRLGKLILPIIEMEPEP